MLHKCYGFFSCSKHFNRFSLVLLFSVLKFFFRTVLFFFLSIKYAIMHGFTPFYVAQKLKLRHTKLFVVATASLNLPMTVGAQGNEVS